MPFGMGPLGWFLLPYIMSWFRCTYRYWPWPWFYPWMPWWMRIYAPVTPYTMGYTVPPVFSKEEEIRMLEEQAKFLEQQLNEIRKRMEELKK